MSELGIEVDHITKEFRLHRETRNSLKERFVRGRPKDEMTFKALADVSFKVPKGSTFGLIGHNGSGKSTMLKLLAGVYRPTKGNVLVNGRLSALLELGAGFHGELTGRENIRLNGAILGYTKREIENSMDAIVEFADIGEFIDEPVKIYSSGMYVRLGFSVSVMMEPEVLIVDEIIAVGDEEFQRKCFDYIGHLRRRGVTTVLVTHSMGIARELCDEAIWLEHGTERASGSAQTVVASYLEDVNTQEALERGSHVGADNQSVHTGNGDARVRSVVAVDRSGEEKAFVIPGDRLDLRMTIDAKRTVRDAVVGLGMISQNDVFVAGSNSKETGLLYDLPKGVSTVDFSLDVQPFQPGTYGLAASISQGEVTLDYTDRAGTMVVRSAEGESEPGYFRLKGDWSSPEQEER